MLPAWPGELVAGDELMDKWASFLRAGTPEEPAWVLELAPPLTLAALIQKDPTVVRNARLVIMGGALYHGYNNGTWPAQEYNYALNSTASQVVWRAQWAAPPIVVTVDVANFFRVSGPAFTAFEQEAAKAAGHPLAHALDSGWRAWYYAFGQSMDVTWPWGPGKGTSALYDSIAAYILPYAMQQAHEDCPAVPNLRLQLLHVCAMDNGYTVPCTGTDCPGCDVPTTVCAPMAWQPAPPLGVQEAAARISQAWQTQPAQ